MNLSNNSITDLRYIDNCTNLITLNLSNNLFNDTSSYLDESSGSAVTYNNLSLIAKLNPTNGGKLQNLYLAGNEKNIINWTPVSSLKWANHTGF